jgi:threonine dehydratase
MTHHDDLIAAARSVHAVMPPTPQYRWPLLEALVAHTPDDRDAGPIGPQRPPGAAFEPGTGRDPAGTELWVKHENHTPVGAFKIRGGIVHFERLLSRGERPAGVVSATRGNHGQSIGFAARRHGIPALIVVPRGNSREKNAAMRAQGVELVEHGEDFQAAREHAQHLAAQRGWLMVPSFHPDLVAGVASYALELFAEVPRLDTVYVPIGLGSGACGLIAARDALGLATEIVGVVSEGAPAYALSLARGAPVSHAVTTELADGMACRTPEPDALAILQRGLARTVLVTDAQIAEAMRRLYECTHQLAEGAGAAGLAAALAETPRLIGRRTAVVLSGANVDRSQFAAVLAGDR